MKRMKKAFALMLAVVMVMAMTVTSFATDTGSITINGISAGNIYEIYKLLDLESYNKTSGVYSYTVNSDWRNFFTTDAAKAYFTVDEQNYATWTNSSTDDATVAAFAKLALAYAKDHSISPVKSSATPGDFIITESSGKFSGLDLGYYLIDSTMGALCGLTTTNPDASINAKNGAPTLQKHVQEDLTSQWGTTNSAEIGQDIDFRVTIHVHDGAQNYVLHDTMEDGFTFKADSVSVKLIAGGSGTETAVAASGNYTVNTDNLDGCTFQVIFSDDFCANLNTNDRLIVYYKATLNSNAEIGNGTTDNPANKNKALLSYGENHRTTEEYTTTTTYAFDLIKTDGQYKLIDGAEFRIYDAESGGNEVSVIKLDDTHYRRALSSETGVNIAVKYGNVRISGLDNGVYYLEEKVTPAGYNQLATRQKFTISDSNLDAVFNAGIYSTGSGVHVVNKSGSMLPETGGMGTVMFITCGSIVVMAAGVLLVTKKRMSMIQD